MQTETLRIGIVGLGPHFMEDLFPSLAKVLFKENAVISALCDISEDVRNRVASYHNLTHAYLTADMQDPEFWKRVDCIICNSWPSVHEYVLSRAMWEQKHCLCEKPVATSSAALGSILQGGSGGLVMKIGHVFRYRHGGRAFIEALRDSSMSYLNIQYTGSRPQGERWGFDSRRAFSLTHLTHAIDFMSACGGEIKSVADVMWLPDDGKESVVAAFRTARCTAATLSATNAARAFRLDSLAILHNGALVRMEDLDNVSITGLPEDEKRAGPCTKPGFFYSKQNAFAEEITGFLSEVRGTGVCLLPGLEEGLHTLLIIEEMQRRWR